MQRLWSATQWGLPADGKDIDISWDEEHLGKSMFGRVNQECPFSQIRVLPGWCVQRSPRENFRFLSFVIGWMVVPLTEGVREKQAWFWDDQISTSACLWDMEEDMLVWAWAFKFGMKGETWAGGATFGLKICRRYLKQREWMMSPGKKNGQKKT